MSILPLVGNLVLLVVLLVGITFTGSAFVNFIMGNTSRVYLELLPVGWIAWSVIAGSQFIKVFTDSNPHLLLIVVGNVSLVIMAYDMWRVDTDFRWKRRVQPFKDMIRLNSTLSDRPPVLPSS